MSTFLISNSISEQSANRRIINVFFRLFFAFALLNTVMLFDYSQKDPSSPHYVYAAGTQVQEWIDQEQNIKIQLFHEPERLVANSETTLKFTISELKSGNPLHDFRATAAISDGDRTVFEYKNGTASHGSLTLKYVFPYEANYQIILRIDRPSFFLTSLASFTLFVPYGGANVTQGIIYAVVLPVPAVFALMLAINKRTRLRIR